MWIEQTKTGKYKYVERYEDYKSGKQKRVSVTFDNKTRETQKKAKLILEEKIAKILNESKLTIKDMNLFDAIDEWLEVYKQQVEEETYTKGIYFKDKAVDYFDKDTLLQRVSVADWNNFLHDLAYTKNLANGTMTVIKSKVKVFITYCVQKGYMDEITTNKITFQRKKESQSKIENKFLEDDEYKAVIAAFDDNKRYQLLFEWQYLTGMRIGEVLALRKSDVHITNERSYASVTGTYSRLLRKRKERTKTKAGTREVDLPSKAIYIYFEACKLSDNDFLFVSSNQTVHDEGNLHLALKRRQKKLKIDKNLSTHIFRHTHISKLAELGVPLNVIRDRVGHESSDITEKIYLHVTKNMKREMVSKLSLL